MKNLFLLADVKLGSIPISYETLVLMSGVLSLVTLIVFFFMAYNIRKIKHSLSPASSDACFDQAKKYEFMREDSKALKMYFEGIYLEAKSIVSDQDTIDRREEFLRKEFEAKIKGLGGEWPDFKALNL